MGHTKRSIEFQKRIDDLINVLLSNRDQHDGHSYVPYIQADDLIQILRENTTDSGCMVNAAADEPIFTLRANDELAADFVTKWAKAYLKTKANKAMTTEELARVRTKYNDARECAKDMIIHRK